MFDLRRASLVAVASTVLCGTLYSVVYDTYLDTSNPLLAHLPHPLADTHYYANKSTALNVYFIKKAWAWTSAAFLILWATSPPSIRTAKRFFQWLTETFAWLVFVSWFFGPSLFERLLVASGGECLLTLPSGDIISVPMNECVLKTRVSPSSHPDLFLAISSSLLHPDWHGIPRIRRGHDVSGHVFLLTMSILFLVDQLKYSFRPHRTPHPTWHYVAMAANIALVALWLFAEFTTSLYFHSPIEKLSGLFLGVGGFAITQIPIFPSLDPRQHQD